MKTLSEQLKYYLNRKNISLATLAKWCKLDRSTMHKYIYGTRPLKNREHLEQIMTRLSLTLPERKELIELFEIETIGYALFCRRKKIDNFIRFLPSLTEKPNKFAWKLEKKDTEGTIELSPGYISNHIELLQTLFTLLCQAHEQQEQIKILMQPQKGNLLNLLIYPAFEQKGMNISHIICLDNLKNDCSENNIDLYHELVRFFLLLEQYKPLYFYGYTKERFNLSNPFPFFICSHNWALQISSDENTGILHTDPACISGFHNLFIQIANCCQPLGNTFNNLSSEIRWYGSYVNPESFQDAIELCSGICSTQFWDQSLIEKYLNPQLPLASELKNQLLQYCQTLYEAKRKGTIRVLLNSNYVLEFIKTGIFKEYPEIFFAEPLRKEDRKLILERILEACEEGWYQICILDDAVFPLQYRWELCANNDTVTIQYFHLEQFKTLFIKEHEFVEEMYTYMDSLWQSNGALSGIIAVDLIKAWMNQYLT